MTTITREQQKQILIDTANHVISRDNTSPYSENLRELARIALASMVAKPVAWECGENIILFNPDTVEAYAKRAEISPKPLYAAPPAPVMPEECPAELPYAQVKAVADLFALCWQSGEVVTYTPDPEKATIWLNNYSGTCVQEYVKLERLQEALAGNSPVSPGGWISCSERMPDNDESKPIAIFTGKCLGQGMFVATYDDDGFFDYWEGMEIIGVTHWMPLPAAPEPEQS